MTHSEERPRLTDFAPLCEAIRPRAFVALTIAQHFGELRTYRNATGWQVWLEGSGASDPGRRLTLSDWAIRWATLAAIGEQHEEE